MESLCINNLIRKYLGHKYDFKEFNCYTFVTQWYKDLGYELPNYFLDDPKWYEHGKNYFIEEYYKLWDKMEKPMVNDIVLMRLLSPVPNHIGIYIGERRFIHCPENQGVVVGDLKKYERIIYGYFHLRNMCL